MQRPSGNFAILVLAAALMIVGLTLQALEWQVIKRWSGNGSKTTESFEVQDREWRINWETRNEPFAGAGIFQIYVYDDRDNLVALAANKQGTGRDTSYVHGDPGRYYLTINSGNVDWSVTVEDQR